MKSHGTMCSRNALLLPRRGAGLHVLTPRIREARPVNTGVKVILSLFATLVLMVGVFFCAPRASFAEFERHFYQPTVLSALSTNLREVSKASEAWHSRYRPLFSQFCALDAVRSSFDPAQKAEDITQRAREASALLSSVAGLKGVRIVEAQKPNIHFSTFESDVLLADSGSVTYRKYNAEEHDVPLQFLGEHSPEPKVIIDEYHDALLYSFPSLGNYGEYRGRILFYLSLRALGTHLIAENKLKITDSIVPLSADDYTFGGIVIGIPHEGVRSLKPSVLAEWKRKQFRVQTVRSEQHEDWALLSNASGAFVIAQAVPVLLFGFTPLTKGLFAMVAVVTTFLLVFQLLSLRQDPLTKLRDRLIHFHAQLLHSCLEQKESLEWEEVRTRLEHRRRETDAEMKKSLPRRLRIRRGRELDALLSKGWDDVFSTLEHGYGGARAMNRAQIEQLVREVLAQSLASGEAVLPVAMRADTADEELDEVLEELPDEAASLPSDSSPEEDLDPLEEVESIEGTAEESTREYAAAGDALLSKTPQLSTHSEYVPATLAELLGRNAEPGDVVRDSAVLEYIEGVFDYRPCCFYESHAVHDCLEVVTGEDGPSLSPMESIVSTEDGLFTIRVSKEEGNHLNRDFKALVDSVLY